VGIAEVTDKLINNHNMLIAASLCSRFRTPKSGCSICADLCPVDAIVISEKGAAIESGCIGCGVCVSVCPNGAFRTKGNDDEKIIGEIMEKVKAQGREGVSLTSFRISCERGDNGADLIVPCLGRLIEAMLIEPIKAGFSGVEISQPECEQCPNSKAALHIDRIIDRGAELYEMVGAGRNRISVKRIPLCPLSNKPGKSVSRREFLSVFKTKAAEAAVTSLPEIGTKKEEKETFVDTLNKRHENFKRSLLIRALEGFSSSKEVYISATDAMLADIEVSSKCTACGVCAALCPTGALTQKWENEQFYLNFKPLQCTNCRVCTGTCMPGAIKMKEKARLNYLLENAEFRVLEAKRKTCSVCRMDFVQAEGIRFSDMPGESDICPLCINRHEKQMAVIQGCFIKSGG